MGKKLDALLGRRTFKTTKFKALVNLAISRLAIFKNHRRVRCTQARSDVSQLLGLGHHERALLRVEHVIKEQNMLDAFVMMEGYCHLLIERVSLIENNKECPDELKEAISSLIFAASRCGDFPELQEIRGVFMARFGKEFVARAVDLRNNCGVNHKMIQKMSTRQPSLESRMKVLKEIASETGITLQLEEASKEKLDSNQNQNQHEPTPSADLAHPKLGNSSHSLTEDIDQDERFSGSMKSRNKYRDVASAAQAAFESAACAAAAARAAVELSRSESQDPDDQDSPISRLSYRTDNKGSLKSGFEKVLPIEKSESESESEGEELEDTHNGIHPENLKDRKDKAELKRSLSASSLDSAGNTLKETKMSSEVEGQANPSGKEIVFDESDDDSGNEHSRISWLKHQFDEKSSLPTNEFPKVRESNEVTDEKGFEVHYPYMKRIPLRTRADPQNLSGNEDDPMAYFAEGTSGKESAHIFNSEDQAPAQHSNIEKKPVSVRTRRVHR